MSPIPAVPALCTFMLGQTQLGIFACGPDAEGREPPQAQLASFEHRGVQFVVREVAGGGHARDRLCEILTLREREIARLVAAGLRNKQIAYELRLSEYTVAAYIKHICYKLQFRNRTAMVTRCNQLGAATLSEVAAGARRGGEDSRVAELSSDRIA